VSRAATKYQILIIATQSASFTVSGYPERAILAQVALSGAFHGGNQIWHETCIITLEDYNAMRMSEVRAANKK
jgi:hypothetical protein